MSTPAEIQAQVTEFEKALTGRKDLTDHAKRVKAAKHRLDAEQKLKELQAAQRSERQAIRARADKAVYGNSGDTNSTTLMMRRDARDRAGRITEHGELRQAFHDAQRDGDSVMAQALAARARDLWAFDVVNEYVAGNPAAQRALEAEAELPREDQNFGLHEAATYALPPATGVLNGLHDYQINAYAADEMDVA